MRRKPLLELDDDQTAAQMAEGFVLSLMRGANAAKLDCDDVAALATLELIAVFAAFNGEAAKTVRY